LPVPSSARRGRCRLRGLPRSGRLLGPHHPLRSSRAARCRAFAREEPSLEVRLPVSIRGALPERLSPSGRRLVAGARVRLSWGSSSLRRLQLQVPRIYRDRLDQPRETRGTNPSSGAALGFSQPLGGLSREDIRRAELPRPAVYALATPWSIAVLLHTAASLGFALQSFPFPRSRAASRRPFASPRVRSRS
jgi:hypothetical protein